MSFISNKNDFSLDDWKMGDNKNRDKNNQQRTYDSLPVTTGYLKQPAIYDIAGMFFQTLMTNDKYRGIPEAQEDIEKEIIRTYDE